MTQEKKYRGVVVPMTTPVLEDGRLDVAAVERIIGFFAQGGVSPLLMGTTGEGNSVSQHDGLLLVQTAVKARGSASTMLIYSGLTGKWPLLRDNVTHPDGYSIDFATISREYAIATMTNNISKDICGHYGTELPSDAVYKAGALDFRNDCGEAITTCMSTLDREQLRILTEAEEILEAAWTDLTLAETDAEWNAVRDETIRQLTELGEPEVFRAYKQKWDAAAAVIVPLMRQGQTANGIELYTPEQYERYPETETEEQQP